MQIDCETMAGEMVANVLAWRPTVDIGRALFVDHHNVDGITARTLLPLTPLPITARGLAHATRGGIVVLPDFVTLAGPLVAHWPDAAATSDSVVADAAARVGAAIGESLKHEEGPLLGACVAAEAFLLTWQTELPFGRPIA